MKNKMIFFTKWPTTGCLDTNLAKSLSRYQKKWVFISMELLLTFQLVISSCDSTVQHKCTVITQNQWWLTVSTELSSCILLTVFAHPLLLRCSPATSASSTWPFAPVAASSSSTSGDCTLRS